MALIVEQKGARLVIQGDRKQLQSPSGGSALDVIHRETEFARIETVRRQQEPWMADATMRMAKGRVDEGAADYLAAGHVKFVDTPEEATKVRASEAMTHRDAGASSLSLAYTLRQTAEMNVAIRSEMTERGDLGDVLASRRRARRSVPTPTIRSSTWRSAEAIASRSARKSRSSG